MTLEEKISSHVAVVAIVGLGHVGLPLAFTIAKKGFPVIGVDVNTQRIDLLNNGKSFSPDVTDLDVQEILTSSQFITLQNADLLNTADVIIICVPTPLDIYRVPNLEYITSASKLISQHLHKDSLVILESTTYPGCTEELVKPLLEQSGLVAGKDFYLAFSPERIDPGNKEYPLAKVPKVVGGIDEQSTKLAALFYSQIALRAVTVSSARAAEMTKLLENIFRLVNISFVNELKLLCDRMDIDIWEIIEAAKTKPYGFMPFYPSAGIGGECIPLDPFYLAWKAKEYGFYARFIELAGEINTLMPHNVVTRVIWALNKRGKALHGSRILILGASYKKNVGDLRESPSLKVMEELLRKHAAVFYHDPHVPSCPVANTELYSVELTSDEIKKADLVIILVDHSVIDYSLVVTHAQLIYDTKNAIKAKFNHVIK